MPEKIQLSPFGSALAGAIGGVISNSIVYPLDTIKTKIQAAEDEAAERELKELPSPDLKRPQAPRRISFAAKPSVRAVLLHVLNTQGVSGFYRGFAASMINTFSMQFAYFYWYTIVRQAYIRSIQKKLATKQIGTAMELVLGALSAALAQIFTIPVSVVATRQQLSDSKVESKSLLVTAREIVKEDGITGLWRGLKPSLVLTVNPAITYGMFERFKLLFLGIDGKMTPGKAFVIGALSKTMATVVTYPYIMAKVRLQAGERYKGAINCLKVVHKEKGFKGWYQGMQAQISKAVLSQALLFGMKEAIEGYTVILLLLFARLRMKQIHARNPLKV